MHEYERTATIPGQRTFILHKLKRKYGKVEVSCIESGQSNQYLLPNLGNHIANNGIQAQAARCHTYELDPNQILAELKVINGHEGFEYQSTESWNSHLVGDFPKNQRSHLPFNSGNHIAGKATPNLLTDEVPQDQSGTNEQGIKFGNLVAADERNNQRKLVAENDGSRMPSISKIGSAEDSVQIDSSNLGGDYSTDEVFAELEELSEVQGNRFGQLFDDWISFEEEIPSFCSNTNEEQNLTAINGSFSFSFTMNTSRKRSRTDYEWDM